MAKPAAVGAHFLNVKLAESLTNLETKRTVVWIVSEGSNIDATLWNVNRLTNTSVLEAKLASFFLLANMVSETES